MIEGKAKKRRMPVDEAADYIMQEEEQKLVDMEQVARTALDRVEQSGIIFLDEIDKIAGREAGHGPDVSREGVQRDILPIVEGTTVNTRYGMLRTDHILFIAAGAFHVSKPTDLIPELQGRFPIRVEMNPLSENDFIRILQEPKNALIKQYTALLGTEGLKLRFTEDAIREISRLACLVNESSENIGARRLHTIVEALLEDISFEGKQRQAEDVRITADYVRRKLEGHCAGQGFKPVYSLMQKSLSNAIRAWGVALLLAVCASFNADCAKIADPQPPEIRIPKPAVDLTARQVADSIVLTVSKPIRNTDGSAASALATIEVFRLLEDASRSAREEPLPEDQFIQKAVRILSIASPRFRDFQQGESFVIRDSPGIADTASINFHGFRYALLFINRKNQMAGFSNQAFIAPVAIPAAPAGLSANATEQSIRLRWAAPAENADGSKPPRIAGYDIFRSEDPKTLSSAPLNSAPLAQPEFEDRDFSFDHTYYYAVRVVGNLQKPYAVSHLSDPVRVDARDVFPPAPPENFNAVREGGDIVLLWVPPTSPDVAGYRIYRRDIKADARILLQKEPILTWSYRDRQVASETRYEYSIQAVDTHGNESAPVLTEADIR